MSNNLMRQDDLIDAIAKRAHRLALDLTEEEIPVLQFVLDITAVHQHRPLRLAELLVAKQVDFAHDIFGIRGHLDRKTGRLRNCFTPRYIVHMVDERGKTFNWWNSPESRLAYRTAQHPDCAYCAKHGHELIMPNHDASPNCESGKKPHCTCDVCF